MNTLLKDIEDKHVVFVDGSCIGNGSENARASYAFFFSNGPLSHYLNGDKVGRLNGLKDTNNRGELLAFIKTLEYILDNDYYTTREIIIVSDSNYCVRIMNEWLDGWIKRDVVWSKENSDMLNLLAEYRRKLKERGFQISSIHMNSHKKAPKDKFCEEYFRWKGNDIVDKYAQKLLQ